MSSDSVVKRKISLPSVLVSEVDIASFRQLLENERNLLELRKDSDSTARLARSLTRLYDRLRQANSFCVLLDFDTIYHFISTEPFSDSAAGLDALSLEAFFLEGKMPYAIPLGAYRELFNHLRHFGLAKNPKFPRSAHDEAGAVSPRRVIYDVLSFISDEEIPDDEDIGGIVDDAVEASTNEQTRLARLFSILLSPRFRGIRNVYNSR
ncbi:MAG TPA: hypothetical protein VMF06_05450, partial [Candidatus Limnocylindria bacterium]|nr:hypothetical protein [Candidatus Limnocylindria bacterium]